MLQLNIGDDSQKDVQIKFFHHSLIVARKCFFIIRMSY